MFMKSADRDPFLKVDGSPQMIPFPEKAVWDRVVPEKGPCSGSKSACKTYTASYLTWRIAAVIPERK